MEEFLIQHPLVQILLGAVIAIITVVAVEKLRKPSLSIEIAAARDREYQEGKPAREMRYLTLKVRNQPLPAFARWMMRSPAVSCHGDITFFHLNGQTLFDRAMPARWAGSQEPVPMQLFIGDAAGYVVDQTRFTALSIVDIPPSGHADLDVAARLDDDAESYGWSNESYLCETPWRNEAWRIEQGRYLLRVRLFTLGEGYSKLFRLYNEGPREKFCLVPAFPHDRVAHEINATR